MFDRVRRGGGGRGRGSGGSPAVPGASAALQRGRRVPAREHAAVGPATGRRHCESYDQTFYHLI